MNLREVIELARLGRIETIEENILLPALRMDIAISGTENCGAERYAFRKRQMQRSDNQCQQKATPQFSA